MTLSRIVLLIAAFMISLVAPGQETVVDWSHKVFSAPSDKVFAAALKAVNAAHYELGNQDEPTKVITFATGRTAWSWGYKMTLNISPAENNTSQVSIDVVRMCGPEGKVSLVASGKKEVQRVFRDIEKELANSARAETPH
jgi:hypothetical protein